MSEPSSTSAVRSGSLGLPVFDSMLIFGTASIAFLIIAAALLVPHLLPLLVLADLWLLGYHHVVASFTKLGGTSADRKQNALLIWALFPAALFATALVGLTLGVTAIVTVYFFWQWFHYVRQSWGLARRYQGTSTSVFARERTFVAMFWAVPVWGLLNRCQQAPDTFLWLPVWLPSVPFWLVSASGVWAAISITYWIAARVNAYRRGELALSHALYTASHLIIFAMAYVGIDDITTGWLLVNVWHNTQYLIFVWKYNHDRFTKDGVPQTGVLPWLAQPGGARIVAYFACCFFVSTLLYSLVFLAASSAAKYTVAVGVTSVTFAVLASMTLNFHHYVVDSIIWKRKRTVEKV